MICVKGSEVQRTLLRNSSIHGVLFLFSKAFFIFPCLGAYCFFFIYIEAQNVLLFHQTNISK